MERHPPFPPEFHVGLYYGTIYSFGYRYIMPQPSPTWPVLKVRFGNRFCKAWGLFAFTCWRGRCYSGEWSHWWICFPTTSGNWWTERKWLFETGTMLCSCLLCVPSDVCPDEKIQRCSWPLWNSFGQILLPVVPLLPTPVIREPF